MHRQRCFSRPWNTLIGRVKLLPEVIAIVIGKGNVQTSVAPIPGNVNRHSEARKIARCGCFQHIADIIMPSRRERLSMGKLGGTKGVRYRVIKVCRAKEGEDKRIRASPKSRLS